MKGFSKFGVYKKFVKRQLRAVADNFNLVKFSKDAKHRNYRISHGDDSLSAFGRGTIPGLLIGMVGSVVFRIAIAVPVATLAFVVYSLTEIPGILFSGIKDIFNFCCKSNNKPDFNDDYDLETEPPFLPIQDPQQSCISKFYNSLPKCPTFTSLFNCKKQQQAETAKPDFIEDPVARAYSSSTSMRCDNV